MSSANIVSKQSIKVFNEFKFLPCWIVDDVFSKSMVGNLIPKNLILVTKEQSKKAQLPLPAQTLKSNLCLYKAKNGECEN